MDGWITIVTELITNDFDKQYEKMQRKLQQLKKEEEKLNIKKQKAEASLNPYQNELKELKQLIAESEKLNMTTEQRKYEDSIHQGMLDQINLKYQKQIDNLNNINKKIKQNKGEQELLNNQIETMNNKIQLQNISESLEDIGKSTSKTIKKIGKWGLAIFGVRAAYGFVRNAVSTLAQYNEQLAADIEYIRFAVASSLEPLIEKIVSLVYKLLIYVNYLAKAWFGIDLFANASADAMNKSAKSAKEIKKSLAGFDEMNLVSGGVSEASAGGTPSVDLSSLENIETPKWLEVVKEIGQWIIDNWQDVLGLILLTKAVLDLVTGNWVGLIIDLVAFIVLGIIRIWNALQDLKDSLTILFTIIYVFIKEDIVKPIANFFANLWVDIKNGAISFWDGTKNVFSTIGTWIYSHIIKPVSNFFVGLWNGIVSGVTTAVSTVKNVFNSVVNFFKNIISTIVNLFKNIGTKVGDVIGSTFKNIINSVLSAIENILNFPIKSINKLIDVINAVPGINLGKLGTFNLPRLKSGGIINMPGKGIPIGGAIGGEAGREGVLPLTDSQAMEELGSAIGRYITINLTNNTNLDGRTIARQQSKVQANRNFAMNR